jgi:ribosomal protein S28E/S33
VLDATVALLEDVDLPEVVDIANRTGFAGRAIAVDVAEKVIERSMGLG